MDTIKVNGKIFIIDKGDDWNNCNKCIFNHKNNNNNKKYPYYCIKTPCTKFIVIREVKFFERIKLWFKKKMNK